MNQNNAVSAGFHANLRKQRFCFFIRRGSIRRESSALQDQPHIVKIELCQIFTPDAEEDAAQIPEHDLVLTVKNRAHLEQENPFLTSPGKIRALLIGHLREAAAGVCARGCG